MTLKRAILVPQLRAIQLVVIMQLEYCHVTDARPENIALHFLH